MTGINKINPVIKKISFPEKGKMKFILLDKREIMIPLSYFPKIKALTPIQRSKWYVLDNQMFSFDDCNEVFHLEQVLGKENIYKYNFAKKSA
ncbi:MAG: hypothetical protein IPL53_13895 [Ignavibacteria bacterium]|nr:hypothetical protein [Ignavibacteria bacterium]